MDSPPVKRRRRLRPIENLDFNLEDLEGTGYKADEPTVVSKEENGHEVCVPAADVQPKLETQVETMDTPVTTDAPVTTDDAEPNGGIATQELDPDIQEEPKEKQGEGQEGLKKEEEKKEEAKEEAKEVVKKELADVKEEENEEDAKETERLTENHVVPGMEVPEDPLEADEEATNTAAEAEPKKEGTTMPGLRRRKNRVKLRKRRQADFSVPEPVVFHPPGASPEKAAKAPPGPDPLKLAEEVLSELLQQQALLCKEVRISIEDRLQEVFEEWRCQHDRINTSAEYCVRQVLEAISGEGHPDATSLALAIEEAVQLGLPARVAITDRLEQLKKLEEVEGIWQCLSTCLRDADRLGVVFWSKEAEQLGLEVPEVLTPALDAMRDEEAARLKRMEQEASFNAQAAQAHERKDIAALRAMAQHAKAIGQDPSAALAALEDLGAEGVQEEEELERLFVSSPNGQNHCFGMYVLVREERGNDMPVWRQLGGERWIYTDELGRWTVGSSKVRQNGFRGSAGFIFCPQLNHGVLPDKMQYWWRFDEETKKWKKDEDITVASEYQEEVIEPKFSKRGKGKAEKKSAKGKGKGAKQEKPKAKAKPKAAARPEAKAQARPAFAPPHHSGLTQPQAMKILELPSDRLCDLREEVINKAYRRLALKWHPDRQCNRLKKEEANAKFVELRNAFELMRDTLKAKKCLKDGAL